MRLVHGYFVSLLQGEWQGKSRFIGLQMSLLILERLGLGDDLHMIPAPAYQYKLFGENHR
jgi:hypothetical protein